MRRLGIVIALLVTPAVAWGDEAPKKKPQPKPMTVEQAADAVLKAVESKDDKALEALIRADAADPWLVADKLCERKAFEAAERFAAAVGKPETSKLPGYVVARRTADPETELRELFQRGLPMLAKDPAAVLTSTEGRAGSFDTVPRLHIARLRGAALGRQRAWLAGAEEYAHAGQGARDLGWTRFALTLYQDAARLAERGGAFAQALHTCEVCLELARELKSPQGEDFGFGTTGLIQYRRGENVAAEAAFESALEVAEKNGLRARATTTIANLGLVYRRLGDLPRARRSQERALVLWVLWGPPG